MDTALDEYAIRVYTLVNHALREDIQHMREMVIAVRAGMAEKPDAFIRKLEEAERDILEEDTTKNDYSGIDKLKGIL